MDRPTATQPPPPPRPVTERPLVLDRPGSCYLVMGGPVDLFALSSERPTARMAVGRIESGGLLFGAAPSLLGAEHLIAVGDAVTLIWQIPDALWRNSAGLPDFTAGIAGWLTALGGGLGRMIEPRPVPDLVATGQRATAVRLGAGSVIGATAGITWVQLPAGAWARFCGLEPVSGLVPLPAGSWLTLDHAAHIDLLPFAEGLARPDWPDALAAWGAAVAELLPVLRGLAEADELNRIRARDHAGAQDHHQTLARFAGLLGNRVPPLAEADGGDGLLDVLRLLGRELGVPVRRPATARRAQMDRLPGLDEIARASGLLLRQIELPDRWWRQEAGLLLARHQGRPVGLVWRGGHYDMIDRHGARRRVTAASAADIAPAAFQIFRPLPRQTGLAAMMAAGLTRAGPDSLVFLAATLIGSLIGQILPIVTGLVFGLLVPAALRGALVQIGLLMLLVAGAGYLIQVATEAARERIAMRGDAGLFDRAWARIIALPLPFLRSRPAAFLAAQLGAGLGSISGFRQMLYLSGSTLGMLVSSLAVIAWHSPLLAGLAAGLAGVHLLIGLVAGHAQARAYRNGEELIGTADAQLLQMINAMVKLRSAAAEDRAVLRWADRFAAMRDRSVRARRIGNLFESWQAAFPILATAALFAVMQGLAETTEGAPALSIAAIAAIATAFGLMAGGLSQFLRALLGAWMMLPGWQFARPLLERVPPPSTGLTDPGPLSGEISFAAVGFAYESGPPVLSDISFRVTPGQMVAIVGPSGSGKSTLVRLLLGLEAPGAGAIYVDGHDLRTLHPTALRRQIGTVLQDEALPPGSILDIVRGISDAGPDEVRAALAAAALDQDVAAMPMGLHTLLPDATRMLSGGQLQRLALARALVQRPPVLVLDEPTSALDGPTQARVMQTIQALPATRIVIAHRLSTIRQAGLILVLDGGRIVEAGTHDELVKRKGRFAGLMATGT
ncbi:ATP-binding cassette domain-containing protein [Tistrella mobilis]|uniref:Beta-(1-->2)glucan export ATP-binding/permease protein ndvA n=1 Tax=Tistrella mobilis (strain KA081020-065) TaxID=1110502 RepID=I3TKK1_TISMK|nr:ATP-binding cassette domain-containing protein [Tistrella mobilis]AFK53289.1 Beta-(1-->2)glucan export ATP-binding/permease protein ndvA [Tistrella mobilis KA081020-065]